MLARCQHLGRAAHHLAGAVAGDALERRIHPLDGAVQAHHHHAFVQAVQHGSRLAGHQLELFALGNVGVGAHHPQRTAIGGMHRHLAAHLHPAHGAVAGNHPAFKVDTRSLAPDMGLDYFQHAAPVIRVQDAAEKPEIPRIVRGRVTDHLVIAGRAVHLARLQVPVPQAVGGGLDGHLQPLLALLQQRGRPLALGDVVCNTEQTRHTAHLIAHRAFGHHKHPHLAVGRAQPLLVGLGFLEGHHRLILGTESPGCVGTEQRLIGLPEDGVLGLTQKPGRRLVGQHIAPLRVFDEHGIGCPLHHLIQQPLAGLGPAHGAAQHLAEHTDHHAIDDQKPPLDGIVRAVNEQAAHRRNGQPQHPRRHQGGRQQARPHPTQQGAEDDGKHEQHEHGLIGHLPTHALPQSQRQQRQAGRHHKHQRMGPGLLGHGRNQQRVQAGGSAALPVCGHRTHGHEEKRGTGHHKKQALGRGQPDHGSHIGKSHQQLVGQPDPGQRKQQIADGGKSNERVAQTGGHRPNIKPKPTWQPICSKGVEFFSAPLRPPSERPGCGGAMCNWRG